MTKKEIIAELKKDKDFADCTEKELEEIAEMEIKSGNIKNYTQTTVEKKVKKSREIKLDDTKVHLIKMLYTLLGGMGVTDNVENVQITNPQKEITFSIGADSYSISLTKHRPPKK